MQARHAYLLLDDYDGTLAETTEPCPGGVDIYTSYEKAIRKLWGEEHIDAYWQSEPVENSPAPIQVVEHLFPNETVPRQRELTEELIATTQSWEVAQVGTPLGEGETWPPKARGLDEYWQRTEEMQARARREGFRIDRGIVSSGFRGFITRSFEIWNLKLPEVMVTDDEVRSSPFPRTPEERVKPAIWPLALAHEAWLEQQGGFSWEAAIESRTRILVRGDNLLKDGGLARNYGAEFQHYVPGEARTEGAIHSLAETSDMLEWNWDMLREGRPMTEIFSISGEDRELTSRRVR